MKRSGRRRNPRFDVLDVAGSFEVRVDVKVNNLSVAGMAIESRTTLIVGRSYAFRVAQGERRLDVNGRVMWCVLDSPRRRGGPPEPVFKAGVQFENVLDEQTLALQKLVDSTAAFDPGTPLQGRFVATLGGTMGIDEQVSFMVGKLSLSGMLVDTEWMPRKNEVVPFEAALGESVVTGHGRVAYIERYPTADGGARSRLGIEFTLLSDRSRAQIAAYIAKLMSQSLQAGTA